MKTPVQEIAEEIFRRKQAARLEAARLPIEETLRILVEMQKRITGEINHTFVGTTQRVLIEEAVEKLPGFVSGRTDSFKHTILPADGAEIGDTVRVAIERSRGATLYGRMPESTHRASHARVAEAA